MSLLQNSKSGTKTEKQCENQPNTGFIIFPSLRIITSF